MPDWLWQGLLVNGFYAILILGSGIGMAYLRKKGTSWASTALYGFAGSAFMAIIIVSFVATINIPKRQVTITPQNAEKNIKIWLDDFHLSTRIVSSPPAYFALVTTLGNGDPIVIGRLKDLDRYISFEATVSVSPEHAAVIKTMSMTDSEELSLEVSNELARAKINNTLSFPLTTVLIQSRIPITETLTESEFMKNIDEMDSAITLARTTVALDVLKYSASHPAKTP